MRAQTPPPHIARKPKNVPMSGGTSRIGPEAVSSITGRTGFEGSPTGGAVVSEESRVKPSSASTANAGFFALLIDHSGARKDVTGSPKISCSVPRLLRRSSRNSSSVISKTRRWRSPWHPISCPASAIRLTSAGLWRAIQPRTKNVAFEPDPSRSARMRSTPTWTRFSRPAQVSGSEYARCPQTWNQSSTSTVRMGATLIF